MDDINTIKTFDYYEPFLEDYYGAVTNGNDVVHGRPLLIKENPLTVKNNEYLITEQNIRYTMGMFNVTIGSRSFETVGYIIVQSSGVMCENYVDLNGRIVLMRWYESEESIQETEYYDDEFRQSIANNAFLLVNGMKYTLMEDRISEYAL